MKITLFVDADSCPVKDDIFRVAERYQITTYVVANCFMRLPQQEFLKFVKVGSRFNEADDWIADRATVASIVVTNDVPLAGRVVAKGGVALSPTGRLFDQESIGLALSKRNLLEQLRQAGEITGGPEPFTPRARSNFRQALDLEVQRLKRRSFHP